MVEFLARLRDGVSHFGGLWLPICPCRGREAPGQRAPHRHGDPRLAHASETVDPPHPKGPLGSFRISGVHSFDAALSVAL